VESFLDNDVYCVAWYEYKFKAFIVDGSDTLTGPTSSPVGEFACEEPTLFQLAMMMASGMDSIMPVVYGKTISLLFALHPQHIQHT